jgi:hypothetical protein
MVTSDSAETVTVDEANAVWARDGCEFFIARTQE